MDVRESEMTRTCCKCQMTMCSEEQTMIRREGVSVHHDLGRSSRPKENASQGGKSPESLKRNKSVRIEKRNKNNIRV